MSAISLPTLLGDLGPLWLVSPIKPILALLPFLPWAWAISTHLEKDSDRLLLGRNKWNAIHMGAGILAVLSVLFVPIFWIGWPLAMVLLFTPVFVYVSVRNQKSDKQWEPLNFQKHLGGDGKKEDKKLLKELRYQFLDAQGVPASVPEAESEAFQIMAAASELPFGVLVRGATRVELLVTEAGTVGTSVINGLREQLDPMPAKMGLKIREFYCGLAGLDAADLRRQQYGKFGLQGQAGKTNVSMFLSGTKKGLHLRLEFDMARRLKRDWHELGLTASQVESFEGHFDLGAEGGFVLLSAPPLQGLSTLSYGFLGRHDAYLQNVRALERQPLITLDGVDMIEYDAEEYTEGYSRHLTAVLRRDPDVVMVDPIDDDKATVRTLLETDEPPVMYLPLRAGSLGESLQKFMTLAGGDAKAAVKNLKYVVHQRLVRRPCPDCSVTLNATPELLQKLGLSEEEGAGLVKGLGQVEVKPGRFETCDRCHGSGFSGVTGVLEVLKVTDEIRGHLANKDLKAALVAARREGKISLQEAAVKAAGEGRTTIEEISRAFAPARKAAPANQEASA